jgi:hypothetical protein
MSNYSVYFAGPTANLGRQYGRVGMVTTRPVLAANREHRAPKTTKNLQSKNRKACSKQNIKR